MSTQITAVTSGLTTENIETLYQAGVIPKDTPKAQIEIFAKVCSEKNLSPFTKQIYLVGYNGKYSIITGIDGFRAIADRTGRLAGKDNPIYDLQADGSFKTAAMLLEVGKLPLSCTVTVYKVVGGVRCPFTHTVALKEFSSGQQKWNSMPLQMLAKVAEAFAIRQGFAADVSGLSIEEEIAAIQDLPKAEQKAAENNEKEATNILIRFKNAVEKCQNTKQLNELLKHADTDEKKQIHADKAVQLLQTYISSCTSLAILEATAEYIHTTDLQTKNLYNSKWEQLNAEI